MSKKIIKFIPKNKNMGQVFDPPEPAKNFMPEWYKAQDKYVGGKKEISEQTGLVNHTVKGCMPVFDVMTAGYNITLPCDVVFNKDEAGNFTTTWPVDGFEVIQSHPVTQYDKFTVPEGYYPVGLKFINPWIIQTPPGYSCLFITPSYRDDLPFYTLPAIVDTDLHPVPVNFPFFIKNSFSGVLEMGIPIVQVIPFKREEWDHKIGEHSDDFEVSWQKAQRKVSDRYKKFFRSPKIWK